ATSEPVHSRSRSRGPRRSHYYGGTIVPPVQRQTPEDSNDVNHLKPIGLALHNHEQTRKLLPPGYVSNFDARSNDTGPGGDWAAMLLPQFDQAPILSFIIRSWTQPDDSRYSLRTRALLCSSSLAAKTNVTGPPLSRRLTSSSTSPLSSSSAR